MRKASRTSQSDFTKKVIRAAKEMVDNGIETKKVFAFIENEYKEEAKQNFGFIDNVQYQKAIQSVVKYI